LKKVTGSVLILKIWNRKNWNEPNPNRKKPSQTALNRFLFKKPNRTKTSWFEPVLVFFKFNLIFLIKTESNWKWSPMIISEEIFTEPSLSNFIRIVITLQVSFFFFFIHSFQCNYRLVSKCWKTYYVYISINYYPKTMQI